MFSYGRARHAFSVATTVFSLGVLGLIPSPFAAAQEAKSEASRPPVVLPITTGQSLVHIGSRDSFGLTERGIKAGETLLQAITTGDPAKAQQASDLYDEIIPIENYGGEYTALQWFARYFLTPEAERAKLYENNDDIVVAEFFDFFSKDNFATLREFLKRKYKLEEFKVQSTVQDRDRLSFLEDMMLFNNPRREEWEQTSEMLKLLPIKAGDTVADIGSGPGYFSVRFSRMVGDGGRVYAVDTVKEHLEYLRRMAIEHKLRNFVFIHSDGGNIDIPENSVDVVYLCSLYHNIYGMDKQESREKLINSIRRMLKPDGHLVIVDNGLVAPGQLPYHGPYIARELVHGQLNQFGFTLQQQGQVIPQRYVLVFTKDKTS